MSQRSAIRKISAILGFGLVTTQALAEEVAGLELKAYVGEPGWADIVDGSYAAAATEIESQLRTADLLEQIGAYNNLCVARTMLREFEAAASACDTAIARAKTYERQLGNYDRSASSTALSNRGVLKMLRGKPLEAIADLERASASDSTALMASERNLAYIDEHGQRNVAGID